jgi:acyl carrier protein
VQPPGSTAHAADFHRSPFAANKHMEIRLEDLKKLLIENCMLKIEPAEITEDVPLFGPGGLGLDSIDAMQMTLAVEQFYKVPIKDPVTAREALQSLGTLRDWLRRRV